MTLAHVGHWLINLIYVAPLAFVIGIIVRDKLKHRRAGEEPDPGSDPPS